MPRRETVAHRKGGRASPAYEESTRAVPIASRLVVVVSCIAAIGAMAHGLSGARPRAGIIPETVLPPAPSVAPSSNPPPPTEQPAAPSARPSANPPSPSAPRIGIVAGHWGSDTGAVCPDGLTEVEINLDIAQRVVRVLQALGYQATLLEEFDPRLTGYRADALVSIHADSCEAFPNATPPASGFKVASVEDSLVPDAEARLVACLAQCYAARTGMFFHANSITYDMTRYHTFYEIDGRTPGAIIETGFMLNDRPMLTQQADLVAQGIVDGIVCFIEGDGS
jgi:N-acetylmuramoyl-L-alanine amidase